jgi:hypothetical protein
MNLTLCSRTSLKQNGIMKRKAERIDLLRKKIRRSDPLLGRQRRL